jgi:thymidylate synthase (FAD)
MRIIDPSFELSTPAYPCVDWAVGVEMLRFIEQQARISHASESLQTQDSWKRFIQAVVIEHGDWSVTEHASITVTFRIDRGLTHEIVRHRLFSFTQESTRFVNYYKRDEELSFIRPADLSDESFYMWAHAIAESERTYFDLVSSGQRPQEARSVLPNALAARIAVTGNLRNWRHFLLMRTTKETHSDLRRETIPLLEEFKRVFPLLYDDIEPNARQIDNLKKAR